MVKISRVSTIVTSRWLKSQLGSTQANVTLSRKLRVLDTSFVRDKAIDTYTEDYLKDHIPQAVFFGLHNCVDSTLEIPRNLPRPGCFTEYVRSLGVWPDTHVVAYDRHGPSSAFRTWWLFRLFGHRNISVLDGGYNKWKADGYETTDVEPGPERSNFVARLDESLLRNYDQMLDNMTSHTEQVVDARGDTEASVVHEEHGGRMPGAKIVAYEDLFNEDDTLKSATRLQQLFDAAGVDLDLPLVTHCNSGLTASGVAAAAHVLGKDIPLYYGSWTEWRQRAPEAFIIRTNAKAS